MMLVPPEKVYLEMDNSSMPSLMNNPFEAYAYAVRKYGVRSADSALVEDLACEKRVIEIQGKPVMTAWIAEKLDFPVRIANNLTKDMIVDLKNLRVGEVDDGLFRVPAGYAKVDKMPIAPPPWAKGVGAAPMMSPPFETTLTEGGMIRIKPVKGYHIVLSFRNPTAKQAAYNAVAFKNGRPLSIPSGYGMPPKSGGETKTQKETAAQADEIVVRAAEGTIAITAELMKAPEGVTLQKFHLGAMHGKQLTLDYRKNSLLGLTDDGTDGKGSRGSVTVFTKVARDMGGGTTAYEQKQMEKFDFTLENGQSRTWKFAVDRAVCTVAVNVLDGALEVRAEQPTVAGANPAAWDREPQVPSGPAAAPAPVQPSRPAAETTPPGGSAQAASKATAKPATRPESMVLILDASGSMWGQIEGRAKIDIAKEVMHDLIGELPDDLQVGLTVYGHRQKGDCRDVEQVVPIQNLNKERLNKAVEKISPKGKTPIAYTLNETARKLEGRPGNKVIVLVTDGLESCKGDPCQVARALSKADVNTKIHIVGFDLKGDALAQLKCIVEPSGGILVGAKNASELREALGQVLSTTLRYNLVVHCRDAKGQPLYATVRVLRQGREAAKQAGRNPSFSLPPDIYALEGTYKPSHQTVTVDDVAVEEGTLAEETLVFAAGKLRVKATDAKGKSLYTAAAIYKTGADELIKESSGSSHEFTVAPGSYDVKVTCSNPKGEQWLRGVRINDGDELAKKVQF